MKNLFHYNSPLMQLLTRVCDLIIINILFIFSCIPIFTIGAAISGMMKACQGIVLDDERGIWNLYTSGFKSNFKQSTVVWLATLVVVISLVCYWMLIKAFCRGALAVVMLIVMGVLAIITLSLLVYLFPLIVRYNNNLREHLRNASILAITRLLLTICLIVLTAVPFILPLISLQAFLQTFIFWGIFGFAFLCHLANLLLKPMYSILESPSMQKSNVDADDEQEEVTAE